MKKIKISELPQSTTYNNLVTIGTNADNASVKVSLAPVGEIDSIKASASAEHTAIRQSLANAVSEQHDTLGISGIVAFDGFVGDVTDDTSTAAPIVRDPQSKVQQGAATVHFSTADGTFLIKQDGSYYPIWDDDYLWQDRNQVPWSDKAYYNVNDGKLYKIGSDNQLHEIALTKLRDDIGILPCKVRMAAPLQVMEGAPTGKYTIWWSQTSKAFFAAINYDPATSGDNIENLDSYELRHCDEYYDYCSVTGASGGVQTATPRTDRIYRSGNDLWQYDKAAGKMVKLGDVTGKDLAIRNLECDDATLQGDVEVTGYLEVGNGLTVQNGLIVENSDITVAGGDIHVQGEAELGSVKTTGDITANGKVSGIVVHGDSATFCQADEVKIDINGNISTEGNLTVKGVANIENGAAVAGELTCAALTASSAEVNGGILANRVEADGDIIAGGSIKTSTIVPGSGSGGVVEVDGQLVTKGWGIMANGDSGIVGNLTVSGAAYADGLHVDKVLRLDKEDVGAMLVHAFHGIRQSLPTDYTAATLPLTPKTRTDGVADIIYVREKKRFYAFWEAQKVYAERFDGDEEYNIITNNKPTTARTDRTWRWGADLYKYDTEAYISAYNGNGKDLYGADLVCVTDAGKALFVKMWREAIYRPMIGKFGWYGNCDDLGNCYGGKNNPQFGLDYGGYYPEWHETPGFFINGITGISYAEARQIYDVRTYGPYPRKISDGGIIRTNMLCCYDYAAGGGQDGQGINTPFTFQSYYVQVIRVAAGLRGQRPTGSCWIRGMLSFYYADNLEEVIGAVWPGSLGDKAFSIGSPFKSKLKYLWISGLSVSLTETFAKASSINVDCLRYLVEKSQATADKPISVTLHADVFAALPEDILTLAETKYVTFVSA